MGVPAPARAAIAVAGWARWRVVVWVAGPGFAVGLAGGGFGFAAGKLGVAGAGVGGWEGTEG